MEVIMERPESEDLVDISAVVTPLANSAANSNLQKRGNANKEQKRGKHMNESRAHPPGSSLLKSVMIKKT